MADFSHGCYTACISCQGLWDSRRSFLRNGGRVAGGVDILTLRGRLRVGAEP